MKQFIINEQLANELVNYLASRPYIEVARLISSLNQMTEVPEMKKKEKEKE